MINDNKRLFKEFLNLIKIKKIMDYCIIKNAFIWLNIAKMDKHLIKKLILKIQNYFL